MDSAEKSKSSAGMTSALSCELDVKGHRYNIFLPHAEQDYIQKGIAQSLKPYELGMLEDMGRRLSPGDLVLDIGANIGNHTLYLASVCQCQVVAFEPNLSLCEAIRASAEINKLSKQVKVHSMALGRTKGIAHFTKEIPENLGALEIQLGSGDIEVSTLDSYVFKKRIRMMKVDVEGMEMDVLEGADGIITKHQPIIYIECIKETDYRNVADWLQARGYIYWDTFNATPTHLFLPKAEIGFDKRLEHLQFKLQQEAYGFREQLGKVRGSLAAANIKYRASTEQVASLRQQLLDSKEERAKLEIQLKQEELRLKEELGKALSEIERLSGEFEQLNTQLIEQQKSATHLAAQLSESSHQINLLSTEKAGQALRASEERTRLLEQIKKTEDLRLQLQKEMTQQSELMSRKVSVLESRVEAAKKTIASQVGAAFLEVLKSPWSVAKLPSKLWNIHIGAQGCLSGRAFPKGGRKFDRIFKIYTDSGISGLETSFIERKIKPVTQANAYLGLARHFRELSDPARAASLARKAYELSPDPILAKWLAFRLYESGQLKEPLALLDGPAAGCDYSASEQNRREEIISQADLASRLPHIPPASSCEYKPVPGSLLYVAASALPYHTTGYTTRTHELLRALQEAEVKVIALTRPGYPWDRSDRSGEPYAGSTRFEGIEYFHRKSPSRDLPQDLYVEEAARVIAQFARERKVSAIQAASNHVNAIPALIAARRLGIPFTYEMRGLWDLSRASKVAGYEDSDRFQNGMDLEAMAAKNADQVFVISEALGEYIQKWGVPSENIKLLPNCINPDTIHSALKQAGPKPTDFTVGYAGSLVGYEGLDTLLEAIAALKKEGTTIRARIVGDGIERGNLELLARKLAISSQVDFLGKLSPNDARVSLAETHVAVLPRKTHKVCEIIPPIKLVESMALGLPVIVSNLGALVHEVMNGKLGSVFQAGDADSLKILLQHAVQSDGELQDLARRGSEHVRSQRVWSFYSNRIKEELSRNSQNVQQKAQKPHTPRLKPDVEKLLHGKKLRVAAVMDEFTFNCFSPECELLQISPENWKIEMEEFRPDFLFIESAWQGKEERWKTKISNCSSEICDAVSWCRSQDIPTIFWSKEDPVHFGTFLKIAEKADYVFTTDIDCVPRYKHELGHERVYFLPFAAQPAIHNPIEEYERKDAFNFAGSYYLRYPERQRDFESLITAVNELKPLEIYDRNYNKTHPHYQFPDSYKKYILGNLPFNEISKAYKGYKYGINLNTIKQSQSMFARRVYELLASNTVVASNFSRGMRLMFGDLVVSSDNVGQLKESLQGIIDDDLTYRKLRLLGLRKVMKEHTYSHRLRFITSKLQDIEFLNPKSKILVLSICRSTQEIERTIECFKKQKEIDAILYIYADHASEKTNEVNIKIFSSKEKFLESIKEILPKNDFIGCFSPQDYYAESYLLDLSLGSMYSNAGAFGKAAYFAAESDTTTLINDGSQYKPANVLLTRRAITRTREITSSWIDEFLKNPESHQITYNEMIATDELNYIENGANLPEGIKVNYQDMILLDKGIALTRMNDISEKLSYIPNEKAANGDNLIILDAVELRSSISGNNTVNVALKDGEMHITSLLSAGSHQYLYAKTYKSREDFNLLLNSQFQLHCDRQLDLRTVFEFLDATGKKISHQINPAGTKGVLAIPNHCTSIRFGLRVEGHGDATIKRLVLGAEPERPATVICKSPYLVLTKQYPAYNDLYKYGFLHSRIRAYKKADLAPDIFCIRNKGLGFREFQGVDIAVGDAELLDATLATGEIKHVLVHLLDEIMWRILQKYVDKIRVTVWVHGAEIQLWQRRQFEFTLMNDTEIERQKKLSDKRKKFWREILPNPPTNLHFVFVSNYLKSEAETDLSVIIPNKNHSIIHNFIDNVAFSCRGKNMEDRLKILSIRPYSKLVYANDLSVAAINELSTRPFFNHLEITLVGDGELFDDNIAPLRKFKNVTIEKRFLNQAEIAKYHSKNGVFLIPTRMDTQGVSRDEAMSSGLVPVTNNVAAIPEFLDASCGLVVPAEDHIAIADAIEHLYSNPMEFLQLSEAAAKRVREQCGFNQTIAKEMDLIRS